MHWLGFLPWWIWVPYLVLWLYVMVTLIMEDREPADTLAWAFAFLLVPVLGIDLLLHRRPRLGDDQREEAVDARLLRAAAGRPHAVLRAQRGRGAALPADVRRHLRRAPQRHHVARGRPRRRDRRPAPRSSPPARRSSAASRPTWRRPSASSTSSTSSGRTTSSPTRSPRSSRSASRPAWRCASSTTTWAASTGTRRSSRRSCRWARKVAKDVVSISHLNYRDHRKIVVIDGEIGYTGGYNVGQEYVDGGERFARWRDTHVRVTGQVVGELEALFAARWFDQTKEDVCTDEYLPAPPAGRRRGRRPLPGHRAVGGGPVAVVAPRPHAGRRQRRAAGCGSSRPTSSRRSGSTTR